MSYSQRDQEACVGWSVSHVSYGGIYGLIPKGLKLSSSVRIRLFYFLFFYAFYVGMKGLCYLIAFKRQSTCLSVLFMGLLCLGLLFSTSVVTDSHSR